MKTATEVAVFIFNRYFIKNTPLNNKTPRDINMEAFRKDVLHLDENQTINVTWKYNKNSFAGKLSLSPSNITIKFTGETRCGREFPFLSIPEDELICGSFTSTFIVYNLKPIRGFSKNLDEDSTFFECEYSVGHLIFLPTSYYNERFGIECIDIHSDILSSWIGITKKQQEIIKLHSQGENLFTHEFDANQISCCVNEDLFLSIGYNLSTYQSFKDFSYGFEYHPSLSLHFRNDQNFSSIKHLFDDIYSLLYFVIGSDFSIKKVALHVEHHSQRMLGFLYFPTKIEHRAEKSPYYFFPLGHDLAFDTIGLPSLPIHVFEKFFSLEQKHKSLFVKLLKYRRMNNIEERFLGYFRLLESLCHQTKCHLDPDALNTLIKRVKPFMRRYFHNSKGVSSFLNGLPRFNRSKYNTEKCISDFYRTLPTTITNEWNLNAEYIKNICTLRNDITHANDFYIDEQELTRNTVFIETLLIFSLGEKIGIDMEIMGSVIHRLNGYHILIDSSINYTKALSN